MRVPWHTSPSADQHCRGDLRTRVLRVQAFAGLCWLGTMHVFHMCFTARFGLIGILLMLQHKLRPQCQQLFPGCFPGCPCHMCLNEVGVQGSNSRCRLAGPVTAREWSTYLTNALSGWLGLLAADTSGRLCTTAVTGAVTGARPELKLEHSAVD